ncbi:hypothetical protein HETIRDRAFT_379095 [Heterobasidion irregulare TC 32-1]|uniref:Uncharacterized protein n=1 Tax=Heterobasidion irregulare (strain TC 32-1) TaxID=747525 RepID=W4KGY4_HETIT|nr:uncharacterized protein HETIRDRAFT_379095 [Heterobasidion irregulare TC 32-1]ETW85123.1 hypothetical protein HETIRDRAFT_379095 [Heterobasidion irregulare TC 32-1]
MPETPQRVVHTLSSRLRESNFKALHISILSFCCALIPLVHHTRYGYCTSL